MDNSNCGHNFLSCYPEIAKEWNYEKNPLGPEMYTPHSGKKVWWKCSRCGYEWDARIYSRASGSSCPACTHQRVWPGHNDLKTLFPEIAQYWDSEKNNLSADQVFPNSAKKYWWTCKKGHSYLESPNAKVNMETGCPVCSGHRLQAGVNDLKTKYPEIAREWDYEKNTINPAELAVRSGKKAYWKCSVCGNEWVAVIASRAAGAGCPKWRDHKKKKEACVLFCNGFAADCPQSAMLAGNYHISSRLSSLHMRKYRAGAVDRLHLPD